MSRGGTRHSLEQRLEIVTKYLSGQDSLTQLSKEYGVSKSALKSWYHRYESKGIDGLRKTHKNKKYDPKFKLEMVHKVLSGEIGLCECCREFNLPSPSILSNWVETLIIVGKVF
nr:helix-turn-helix domain-containing protein [Limosilactobacillus gastricus]